jgi:hypothetical protein
MKLVKVLSLFGVAIVPHLAFADTVLPPDLGPIKAMLDYCTQIDPKDAATFGRMWSYTAEHEKTGAPAAGFQAVYDSTISRLKGFPTSAMASACHSGAAQWPAMARTRPISGRTERPESKPGRPHS